jgi:hypothetical protein
MGAIVAPMLSPSFCAKPVQLIVVGVLMTTAWEPTRAQTPVSQEGVFLPQVRIENSDRPVPVRRPQPFAGQLASLKLVSGTAFLVRIVSLSKSELVVTVGGVRQVFRLSQVDRLSVEGDSLKNGAIIGAAVGVLWGFLATGGLQCSDCPGAVAGSMMLGSGAGVGIGIGIDAHHIGTTIVYSRRAGLR